VGSNGIEFGKENNKEKFLKFRKKVEYCQFLKRERGLNVKFIGE
jgi:hypothetical protein